MSYKDEAVLRELYVDQDLSMQEVADELDCCANTVSVWANKFDIETGRLTDKQRSDISLTNRQHQLIKGVLMGDGCVQRRDKETQNPYFVVTMKNREFLEWLSNELGDIVASVNLRTGEYASTLSNEQSTLKTYSHPAFNQYANWYSSGVKRWPVDEEFTELEFKMLYVTDGSIVKHRKNDAIKVSAINECDRKELVSDMFERELGLDISWHVSDAERVGTIYISSDQADLILDKDPVPGFEYKWGEQYWADVTGQ